MSRKSLDTRKRILDTTWKLLETEPEKAVRMADIAKAAGLTRQALYLHFPKRSDLMIATVRHLDEVYDVDTRLIPSRTASSGRERLAAFIEAWGNYIPLIYGVAKALMAMKDTDADVNAAWTDRMTAVRHGCAAAVNAIEVDGALPRSLTPDEATDILWALLSISTWEQLTQTSGWSQDAYLKHMTSLAHTALIRPEAIT
ncbi:MAG: TetR/AcrR family transcriptional regulator [Pseudomonadota bacterium]